MASRARAKPTDAELAKAEAIITRLTPTRADRSIYLSFAEHGRLAFVPHGGRTEARIVASKVFPGCSYLVFFADDDWFERHARNLQAIACRSDVFGQSGIPEAVYAREAHRKPGYHTLRPILEHEFVHINQFMRGAEAKLPSGAAIEPLIEWFVTRVQMEFEAYLVEYVRWPRLVPQSYTWEGGIEPWCFLLAHTQALELLWTSLADNVVEDLIPKLPDALRHAQSTIGVDAGVLDHACAAFVETAAIARRVANGHGTLTPTPGREIKRSQS